MHRRYHIVEVDGVYEAPAWAVNRIDNNGRGFRYVRRVSGHERVRGPPVAPAESQTLAQNFRRTFRRVRQPHVPPVSGIA